MNLRSLILILSIVFLASSCSKNSGSQGEWVKIKDEKTNISVYIVESKYRKYDDGISLIVGIKIRNDGNEPFESSGDNKAVVDSENRKWLPWTAYGRVRIQPLEEQEMQVTYRLPPAVNINDLSFGPLPRKEENGQLVINQYADVMHPIKISPKEI